MSWLGTASSLFSDREELLTLAEEAAGIGVWDIDLATGNLRGTVQFFRIMGLPPTAASVPIETTRRLRHPEDRERVQNAFNVALASGADKYTTEYRIIRPDGESRWIAGHGRVFRDSTGLPVHCGGVDIDITERKLAEAALRDSEQRFRRVFEQSPLGKAMAGLDLRLRSVNPALCKMLGYTETELVGRSFLDIVHPDDRDACAELGKSMADGSMSQIQIEARFLRKSGDALWVSVNVGPIRDTDGRIVYSLGIIEDIDERKRSAQALNERLEQQAEERAAQLQAFFVNSPDWLTLQRCTPDGHIVYADINPTSEIAYGLSRDDVVGRTVEEVLGVEQARVPMAHLRECLRTGQPQHYVARRSLADRTTTIDVMFVLVPEVAPGGDRFVITTARDLTEREKLEAQLRQALKMEAVGQLTGGVAHDFNNLLAIIGGNAELAKRRPGGDTNRQMDNILRATERGVALTRQLLSFSRRNVATPQVIDLRAEVPRMAEMLRASLRGNIQMRIDVADSLWPIEVDVAELEMALVNIAVNARDAMQQGGTLTIDVRNATQGGSAVANEHVAIALRDTGTGIPPEVIGKVFDPFFTTKEPGEGTGLGLSQVYGFAQQSGGSVSLDSTPGRGTTITIRLPRSYKPLATAPDGDEASGATRISGRILLVEDNAQVAEVTAQMLRDMGFQVEIVNRARKAMARLDRSDIGIDLLLTDVVMPGISGRELAERVSQMRPDIKTLYMSGYTDRAIVHHGILQTDTILLQKPFSMATLAARVRDILTEPELAHQ
jgi:PAS domain S-box-containing protein